MTIGMIEGGVNRLVAVVVAATATGAGAVAATKSSPYARKVLKHIRRIRGKDFYAYMEMTQRGSRRILLLRQET
jgi:hypothetical protein